MENIKLELKNVYKDFKRVDKDEVTSAIRDISFTVHSGEFVSLVGTSGCGKSTILRLVAGLIDATSGEILVDDKKISGPSVERGMVFQKPTLFPWLTVRQNIEFSFNISGKINENREKVNEMLEKIGLKDFENDKYNVLCNSMLLTEGWDCPSVDCIIVLRPTKVRSLYSQMVGRGTRLCEGKDHLLLLDFLWHTERHELCHPANLICENDEVAKKMTQNLEEKASASLPEDVLEAIDIEDAEKEAQSDVIAQREESLAKQLAEMRKRKRKLVDPLQFEMSIMDQDLQSYTPSFGWEMAPASEKQIKALEKYGIYPDSVNNAGKASLLLDRLHKRQEEGLATPKQIRLLENKGFKQVGTWSFESARKLINRIAASGWRVPNGIDPATYKGD